MIQTVCISFFRFDRFGARLWAFAQMGFARFWLMRRSEIKFWKLFGSGTGEGFTPVPNFGVYAIMTCFDDAETAAHVVRNDPLFDAYRARAAEHWSVMLTPTSVRGVWSDQIPFAAVEEPDGGPIFALTRATIKPSILMKFWGRVPAISNVIGSDPNVIFKMGVGEVPWFHQVTLSIWPDAFSMAEFARRDGPHARAIKAVRAHEWFKEELYARFNVKAEFGSWAGMPPVVPADDIKEVIT